MKRERYSVEFDNWAELVDCAVTGEDQAPALGRYSRRDSPGPEWFGADWADAVDLARSGWAEGAGRIERDTAQLFSRLAQHAFRMEPSYGMVGPGTVDLPRYMAGHPEPYQVWKQSPDLVDLAATRGVLKIGFNITASAGIEPDVMYRRGAALIALVDCLERAGFRCEVDLAAGIRNGAERYRLSCRVKEAQDPVEPDLFAFVAAHAAAFRRIIFSVLETADPEVREEMEFTRTGSYGSPNAAFVGTDHDVVIEQASYREERWQSIDSAAQWVRELLQAQGVEVLDAD